MKIINNNENCIFEIAESDEIKIDEKYIVGVIKELIEKKYEANPNETNLLDLLFTLLAQDESLYKLIKEITSWKDWLNYGEYIVTGELDTKIKILNNKNLTNEDIHNYAKADLMLIKQAFEATQESKTESEKLYELSHVLGMLTLID